MKLTASAWRARASAYEEAAEHLAQTWTENPFEYKHGLQVAEALKREAQKCHERGDDAETLEVWER